MKKTAKVLGGFSAVALSTSLTNHVYAMDAVTVPQADGAEAVQAVQAETPIITQATVDQSAAALSTADQAVAAQTAVVADSKADDQAAVQAVEQAQALVAEKEAEVALASPDRNLAAQADLAEKTEVATAANQAVEAAQATQAAAQEAVKAQQTQLAQEAAATKSAQEAKDQAQAEVNKAQEAVDLANPEKAKQNVAAAETELKAAAEKVSQSQNELTKARQDVAAEEAKLATATANDLNRQNAIAEARELLGAALSSADSKQTALNQAQAGADTAKGNVDKAQTALTKAANAAVAGISDNSTKITVSDDYVNELRKYVSLPAGATKQASFRRLVELSKHLKQQTVNPFVETASDLKRQFDPNNTDNDTQTELSLFASNLINQIRQRFGTEQTSVTSSSLDFAKAVADGYVNRNWTFENTRQGGHNEDAINEAARARGLATSDKPDVQYYENMYTINTSRSQISVAAAKRFIHTAIIAFMFSENEFDHAHSISGLLNTAYTDATYLGLDFSSRKDAFGVHFLTVDTNLIPSGNTSFNRQPVTAVNSARRAELQEAAKQAQTALNQAQVALNQARIDLATAQNDYNQAQAVLNRAQAQLAQAQAVPAETPAAEAALKAAQDRVEAAQAAADLANQGLATANQNLIDAQTLQATAGTDLSQRQAELAAAQTVLVNKQDLLDQAEASLAAAQTVLDNLLTVLNQANSDLARKTQAADDAQAALQAAQAQADRIVNAMQRLDTTKAELALARQNLADAEKNRAQKLGDLLSAQVELEALINAQQVKAKSHEELLAAFQAQQKTQEADDIIQATVLSFGSPANSASQSVAGQQTSVSLPLNSQTAAATLPVAGQGRAESVPLTASASALPSTGSAVSHLALYGLTLAAGLGLSVPGLRKGKKN